MKLVYEPTVKVIQSSVPNEAVLKEIADYSAPEGEIHTWEPDASLLEMVPIFAGRVCYQSFGTRAGRKTADEYLSHIIEVKHFSIIEHSHVTFYLEGVSRSFTHELVRHRLHSYSQLSQRYVAPDELGFVVPPLYRGTEENPDIHYSTRMALWNHWRECAELYNRLLRQALETDNTKTKKQVREAARCVLPNATETKIVVTANLRAWVEMLIKRNSDAADAEIHQVAEMIEAQLSELAPNIFRRNRVGTT